MNLWWKPPAERDAAALSLHDTLLPGASREVLLTDPAVATLAP